MTPKLTAPKRPEPPKPGSTKRPTVPVVNAEHKQAYRQRVTNRVG